MPRVGKGARGRAEARAWRVRGEEAPGGQGQGAKWAGRQESGGAREGDVVRAAVGWLARRQGRGEGYHSERGRMRRAAGRHRAGRAASGRGGRCTAAEARASASSKRGGPPADSTLWQGACAVRVRAVRQAGFSYIRLPLKGLRRQRARAHVAERTAWGTCGRGGAKTRKQVEGQIARGAIYARKTLYAHALAGARKYRYSAQRTDERVTGCVVAGD